MKRIAFMIWLLTGFFLIITRCEDQSVNTADTKETIKATGTYSINNNDFDSLKDILETLIKKYHNDIKIN